MGNAAFSYRSATDLVDAIASGQVSAVELTDAAIARIERHDATLNAVCVPDFDRARVAARQADLARYGDRTTIRFAEPVEREFGGFTPPPLD